MNNCENNHKSTKKKKKKSSKRRVDELELMINKPTADPFGIQQPQILPLAITKRFDRNCEFAQSLSRDYRVFRHILRDITDCQQKRIQDSERELDEMKKYYIKLKMEEAELKRKRWCNVCQMEATFISADRHYFYCTSECEQAALHLRTVAVAVDSRKNGE